MPSVRIDSVIAVFMRGRMQNTPALRKKPMSIVLSRSIKALLNKDDNCLKCEHHKHQVAFLEIGRQRIALKRMKEGVSEEKNDDTWITLRPDVHKMISDYAIAYRRPLKVVAEQAILEYLNQPEECKDCVQRRASGRFMPGVIQV